jgi:isopenicillin-N N-acyltransferase-like protein
MDKRAGKYELIRVEGAARERGRQYGARTASRIQQNVESYLRLIEFHSGQGREMAMQAASAYGPIIEEYAPDLLAEMKGIAEGAGCALVDILLINARSELMLGADECTSLAAAPEVTDRGQVLLGQNWDWFTSVEPEPVLLHIRQPEGPEILTLTEAGQLAKIGLNSAGLGVCLNFLEHSDRGQGVPVHVILRQMLGCEALGDAIRAALGVPRGGAANILMAHGEGEILDLELTATDADHVYGDAGWLVHANHFESDRLRAGDTSLPISRSTLARGARARRLLAGARDDISADTFRNILTDHAYAPYAICRHADPIEPSLQQTATRASVIMDLQARSMCLAVGQPCQQPYEPIALETATAED